MRMGAVLETEDRAIINALQGDFPVCDRPFAVAAARLGLDETELMSRIGSLLDRGVLSRFGPMYNAEAMGGSFCLCAMAVPPDGLEDIVARVNAHPEVAHNYERTHTLNVWFVLGTEDPARINAVVREIEAETGLRVYTFPKEQEFYIGLKVEA